MAGYLMTHKELNIKNNNILPVFEADPPLYEAGQGPKEPQPDIQATGHHRSSSYYHFISHQTITAKLTKIKHLTRIKSEINKQIKYKIFST